MSESKLVVRDVYPSGTPPTVPDRCPTCGAQPPHWRFQQSVSLSPPNGNARGVFLVCSAGHRHFFGEGNPDPPERGGTPYRGRIS